MEDIPGQLSSVGVPVEGHLIDLVRARVSWMGLFHGAAEGGRGYMPGLMRLKALVKSLNAPLSAEGSTHLAAWRWGAAHPPLWSLGTAACLQPSHRIYSPHPWQNDTNRWERSQRCVWLKLKQQPDSTGVPSLNQPWCFSQLEIGETIYSWIVLTARLCPSAAKSLYTCALIRAQTKRNELQTPVPVPQITEVAISRQKTNLRGSHRPAPSLCSHTEIRE